MVELLDDNVDIVCDYGCNTKANYYFESANKYCCSKSFFSCEGHKKLIKDKSLLRNRDSKRQILLRKVENGELKCKYCGGVAKYVIGYTVNDVCCSPKAKLCPNYSKYIGDIYRDKYKKNPILRDQMSRAMKECQNRPEVVFKKMESMTILHNGDCLPCKEFQNNYKKGRIARRLKLHEKNYNTLIVRFGVPTKHIPEDIEERSSLLKELRYRLARNKESFILKGKITNNIDVKEVK